MTAIHHRRRSWFGVWVILKSMLFGDSQVHVVWLADHSMTLPLILLEAARHPCNKANKAVSSIASN